MKRLGESGSKTPSPRHQQKSNGSKAQNGVNSDGARCNVEKGVADINSQLCSTMLTMILSEDAAKRYYLSQNSSVSFH